MTIATREQIEAYVTAVLAGDTRLEDKLCHPIQFTFSPEYANELEPWVFEAATVPLLDNPVSLPYSPSKYDRSKVMLDPQRVLYTVLVALRHPDCPSEVLHIAFTHKEKDYRKEAVKHPNLPDEDKVLHWLQEKSGKKARTR